MKIRRRSTDDIIDARGASRSSGGGGLAGLPLGLAGGVSIPILIVIVIVSLLFGGGGLLGGGSSGFNVDSPLSGLQPGAVNDTGEVFEPQGDVEELVAFVVADLQEYWSGVFARSNMSDKFRESKLVLFTDAVSTGCGQASSATGPFYCPPDERMYIDLGFFEELSSRFGAPGDFAQAYVIAHEMGHHIQNLTGTNAEVRRLEQQNPDKANELSVRVELQADCLAGVWANSTRDRDILEPGDVEEGLTAAAAVGDDRLQQQAGVRVNSETWTHGSSAQRQKWFTRGFDSGDPGQCDTFSGGI